MLGWSDLTCSLETPQSTRICSDVTSAVLESLFKYSPFKISIRGTGPDTLTGKTRIFSTEICLSLEFWPAVDVGFFFVNHLIYFLYCPRTRPRITLKHLFLLFAWSSIAQKISDSYWLRLRCRLQCGIHFDKHINTTNSTHGPTWRVRKYECREKCRPVQRILFSNVLNMGAVPAICTPYGVNLTKTKGLLTDFQKDTGNIYIKMRKYTHTA